MVIILKDRFFIWIILNFLNDYFRYLEVSDKNSYIFIDYFRYLL